MPVPAHNEEGLVELQFADSEYFLQIPRLHQSHKAADCKAVTEQAIPSVAVEVDEQLA